MPQFDDHFGIGRHGQKGKTHIYNCHCTDKSSHFFNPFIEITLKKVPIAVSNSIIIIKKIPKFQLTFDLIPNTEQIVFSSVLGTAC
jgi:hypothetical protein